MNVVFIDPEFETLLQELETARNRFDNVDPSDELRVQATIYEVKAAELKVGIYIRDKRGGKRTGTKKAPLAATKSA